MANRVDICLVLLLYFRQTFLFDISVHGVLYELIRLGLRYKLICENVCMVSLTIKKRESHFLFCTPHPCPEWGVSLYFEKCLPAFCVVGGIDCVRDSKVGTP